MAGIITRFRGRTHDRFHPTMSRYLPEPPFAHGSIAKTGVLLVNLGTPEAPTARALRPYLKQFLSDPRVIEIPRLIWWPILHLFILVTRPVQSARRYAQIWGSDGAPLLAHTQRQTLLLRGYLGERIKSPLVVDYAMRYGRPSVPDALARMKHQGCDRILVLPLYPQYAASTTATAFDAVFSAVTAMRNQPALRGIRHFPDDPGYIAALAQSVRDHWTQHGRPDQLIMSFHGVPRFSLDKGDPYHCECHKTGRLLAEALHLSPAQYQVTFQSRFGRAEWLKPYTVETLMRLGKQNLGCVDVICPGFVADCLETLEEIALEGKAIFLNAGGREYRYIPCLNERPDWIHALADIAAQNLVGWVGGDPPAEQLVRSREHALALGAPD